MQDALVAIKDGGVPPPSILPSFQEIKDTLGFNRYYKEEKQYQLVSYDVHFYYSVYSEHYLFMQFPNHMLLSVGQVKDATTLEAQIDNNLPQFGGCGFCWMCYQGAHGLSTTGN